MATSTKTWWGIRCPLASFRHEHGTDSSPSFRVKINPTGQSRMRCFSCQWGGNLYDLVLELKHYAADADLATLLNMAQKEDDEGELKLEAPVEEDPTKIWPYPAHWLESFPTVFNSGLALHYLKTARKGGPIPTAIAAELDLRWDPDSKRIAFPYWTKAGEIVGLHGRAISSATQPKYMMYPYAGHTNPHCWVGEDTIDFDKPVVIAESVFDYARTYQVYRNVLTPRTANVWGHQLDRILEAGEIVTLFDPDQAGTKARQMVTGYFKSKAPFTTVRHVHLSDDMDAGDHTPEALAAELSPFVPLDKLIS